MTMLKTVNYGNWNNLKNDSMKTGSKLGQYISEIIRNDLSFRNKQELRKILNSKKRAKKT